MHFFMYMIEELTICEDLPEDKCQLIAPLGLNADFSTCSDKI